jgi:biopolymer transport protein ExbB/TolQ
MSILLGSLLLAACLVIVALPLVRRTEAQAAGEETDALAEGLRRARERVYEEIRALQQERFLGNLTPAEYQEQLEGARLRAANLAAQQADVQSALAAVEAEAEAALRSAAEHPPA